MRNLAVLLFSVFALWGSDPASAQVNYLQQGSDFARQYRSRNNINGVAANGRCGGISYGTGERSCGTASGGPVGGNSSRNE